MGRQPKLDLIAPSASPLEAAAIVAALERFMRETAPRGGPPAAGQDPWLRAAILEGVERENWDDVPDSWSGHVSGSWINT